MEPTLFALENHGILPRDTGYRGIWYYNQPSGDEYVYKYSGGLGTYPHCHVPIAIYAPEVDRTFFVYGGAPADENTLVHCISYFDHATGTVPRPAVLLDKGTDDAHDNPTMIIDGDGHIWVFSNAHGTSRPSFIHRSLDPYSIERFEYVMSSNFSYFHPWYRPGRGFIAIHTRYSPGRRIFWMTSPDGRSWSAPKPLFDIHKGHYHYTWRCGDRIGIMCNYHPEPVGLNARTNIYYLETDDFGETWKTAAGEKVTPPLTEPVNPALVDNTEARGLLAYIKGLCYDAEGNPVVHYITSKGYETGPENDPRLWTTARWTGAEWDVRPGFRATSNYDFGPLYVEEDGSWTIVGPSEQGPQPYNTGGEVAVWKSHDKGTSWTKARDLTHESEYNHAYIRRPVNAHPGFRSLWADGHGRQPSASRLYFTDSAAQKVWRLPVHMSGDEAEPEVAWR